MMAHSTFIIVAKRNIVRIHQLQFLTEMINTGVLGALVDLTTYKF